MATQFERDEVAGMLREPGVQTGHAAPVKQPRARSVIRDEVDS
ncbi:MAG TPA: hypothetical protein VFD58_08760 [Blastocatellia bacterium]|nr:hypothetical protein [Blastocatellia bacterium]